MNNRLTIQNATFHRHGFTLLELLVVVFILSILAVSAVSLTENLDSAQDQFRVEATKNQGIDFDNALINTTFDNRGISGFAADMGALPANLMELAYGVRDLATPIRFPAFQLVTPVFDPLPTLGFNDENGDALNITTISLGKGFRGQQATNGTTEFFHGSYINLGIGSTTDFKSSGAALFQDGWGNGAVTGFYTVDGVNQSPVNSGHTLSDLTHGWQLAVTSDASYVGENFFGDTPVANGVAGLALSSAGRDGLTGGSSLYDIDQAISRIVPDDWSIPAGDLRVEVFNDLPEGNVFENQYDANGFTYRVFLLACNARAIDNPVDGTLAGWKWAQYPSTNVHVQIPSGSSRIFTLSASANGPLRVPVGEHVALLVRCNAAGVPLSSIGFPSVYVRTLQDGNETNKKNEIQQIRFIDSAVSAVDGSFRIWVDRDGNSSPIPTASIGLGNANDIAQNSIYQALTTDNGSGQTIIQLGQDDCTVTRIANNIWNVEFKMLQGDGDANNDLYTNMEPMQIDASTLNFNATRIHATPVLVRPGNTSTLRLNLSAFTP